MHRLAAVCLLLLLPLAASAQQVGEHVTIRTPLADDLYAAGRLLAIESAVDGDVVAAGQSITIAAPVAQDLIVAGEQIDVTARVGDDVRAAGRRVHLGAEIADHLVAAGETVMVGRNARVGSFAWLAGRELIIEGEIGGAVKAVGESVRIAGHIAGDVDVKAEHIELLPGARIDGNLTWSGKEPRVASDTRIAGRVTGQPSPERERHDAIAGLWFAMLFIAAFAVAGLVLYLLFPDAAARAAAEVRRRPVLNAVLGFGVLFLTPFAVVLLFVTGVGWLLGLVLLILYLASVTTSGLIGSYVATEMALAARKSTSSKLVHALALVGVIVLVGVLQMVPVVGWLIALLLVLWGLGAIAQLTFRPALSQKTMEGAT